LIVGAHYDTVKGTKGANDNASGVAALIEFASYIKKLSLPYTIHLVAFANEELPFIRTKNMGSYHYAKKLYDSKCKVMGMISLETIGYYSHEKNSQRFSSFLPENIYPNIGNFIAFISNMKSKKFLANITKLFAEYSTFPHQTLSAPGWLPGINSSDHWSFWKFNYPAIMVTDTAPLRYPYYHKLTDTYDKVNYHDLVEVTKGLLLAITNLTAL